MYRTVYGANRIHLLRRGARVVLSATWLLVGLICFGEATRAGAQTNYQRLISFGPEVVNGSSPRGQLLEASDGLLYGATYQGGSNNLGTVFRTAKDGSGFTVLHTFTTSMFPFCGPVEGGSGSLYGVTSGGGAHSAGTVFTLKNDGTGFVTLHDFNPAAGEGNAPLGRLLKANDGKFYGTTAGGGGNNLGSIFRLNGDGSGFQTLYSFLSGTGSSPVAGLIQGQDGSLYGVAKNGGTSGMGTVFRVAVDGSGYSVLHEFGGGTNQDGALPLGNLFQAGDGFLYGTTYGGGNTNDGGTIFKLSTNGTAFSVLHIFGLTSSSEASVPVGGLTQGDGGFLYGTTTHGGINDGGVAFAIKSDGSAYTVLHYFAGAAGDGSQPFGTLLKGSDGALYGSTYFGGDANTNGVGGTLFRLFSGPAQVRITSLTLSTSGTLLTFAGGAAGQTYEIQASTDLSALQWQAIGSTNAGIDGRFEFTDATGPMGSLKFFRSTH